MDAGCTQCRGEVVGKIPPRRVVGRGRSRDGYADTVVDVLDRLA